MNKLKEFALRTYEDVSKYFRIVMDDFPMDKLDETFGESKSANELLFHLIATPHFWMKKAGRPFEFRAKYESKEEMYGLLDKQLNVFRELLENKDELHWTPPSSIPWIMIRCANHMMHHLSMITFIRGILGLPPLQMQPGLSWGSIVDIAGDIHYSG